MVSLGEKIKARFTKKKEEIILNNNVVEPEPEVEVVEATIERVVPPEPISFEERARAAQPSQQIINIGKESTSVFDIGKQTNQGINLSKPVDVEVVEQLPIVVRRTDDFSKQTESTQSFEPSQVTEIKGEPAPWIEREVLAKFMLGVTFTGIVVDGIFYVYDSGFTAVMMLIFVSAVIQFLLVAEYKKPTMH